MSDSAFWKHYEGRKDPLGEQRDQEDGAYHAWQSCQQGSVMGFKLVPTISTGEPIRQIPYLQPITIEYHRDTEQLCLLCHSTGMTVFLEGRGLQELADLIAEKRIKSIVMFDPDLWPPPNYEAEIVSKITVEQSS